MPVTEYMQWRRRLQGQRLFGAYDLSCGREKRNGLIDCRPRVGTGHRRRSRKRCRWMPKRGPISGSRQSKRKGQRWCTHLICRMVFGREGDGKAYDLTRMARIVANGNEFEKPQEAVSSVVSRDGVRLFF